MSNSREEDLAYALLWLRNHYDLSGKSQPGMKAHILDRIDRVLADGPPITGAHGEAFRQKYPSERAGWG